MVGRRARATALVLAFGLGLGGAKAARARELSGKLDPQGQAVYQGYAYGVYEIEAAGGELSVAMNATGLDGYLILRSPEERFLTNDDGEDFSLSLDIDGAPNTSALTVDADTLKALYDVSVFGRVITISHKTGQPFDVDLAITSQSTGSASLRPQLLFQTTGPKIWSTPQTVTVADPEGGESETERRRRLHHPWTGRVRSSEHWTGPKCG